MKTIYKFSFFGAGEVIYDYLSPFYLHVFFYKELTEKQKEQIKKKAPSVGEVVFLEKCMDLFDDLNIHVDISKNYKTSDGIYMQEDTVYEYFECADSQVQAYNLDIERWLKEVHEISPIYFAYKDVENEMYGHKVIKYSDWHHWSLQQYKTILPYFETEIDNGYNYYDFSEKANIIQDILTKTEEVSVLEEKHIRFLYPGKLEFKAFKKGDIEPLKNITNSSYAEKTIKRFSKKLKKKHKENINKYADVFLNFETILKKQTFEELIAILFKYYDDIDSTVFKNIAAHLTNTNIANAFAEKGFQLVNNRKYKKATKLFAKLLMAKAEPCVESGFYTNVLWVLQNDNTGIAVNKKRNLLALQKCLPMGKEYPAIFFNACCLYVEMEYYEEAYTMVEIALANYFDVQTMLHQIKNDALFKTFRERTEVIHLLENYRFEAKVNPEPRLISYSEAFHLYNITTIKNNLKHTINFTTIILINGHVEIEREFANVYNYLVPEVEKVKTNRRPLVLVNGNLTAKSIAQYGDEYIVAMGRITCDNTTHKEIIEVGETNFEYVPLTAKRHHEE